MNDEARAAVEAALAERGYAPDPDARQRVDVAFAIAPIDVEVVDHNAADKGESLMSRIALCKQQRYVLAVAILDRDDGRVLFRNRASLARCQRAADAVLPVLARAVVEGA